MNKSSNINRVAAVIPFFNESKTIKKVVDQTLKHVETVIAVDDGSTDNSGGKVREGEGVIVLKYESNHGKGFALRKGLKKGVEEGFTVLVTLDADLQHNPEEIPLLVSQLKNYHIVIGNRLNDVKRMPFQRIMSNKVTSKLLTLKTRQKIVDSQCGFRAYRAEVIKNVHTVKNGYEAESEILIKASRMGYKIGFVNISTIYGDERSKMSSFKTTFAFIKLLFS